MSELDFVLTSNLCLFVCGVMKLFKDLESYDRKPPDKHIVQTVADTYELLGMVDEKERVMTKYSHLLLGTASDDKPRRSSRKKKKPGR